MTLLSLRFQIPVLPRLGWNVCGNLFRMRGIHSTREAKGGWRSCGIHVREALTAWQEEVPLDLGKNITDKAKLTKDQRLDNLRHHLREFTHIAGHPDPSVAKTWTRDDALLAFGRLCV